MNKYLCLIVALAGCGDNSNSPADLSMHATDLSMTVDGGGGCDTLKQDCPSGQKCVVVNNSDPTMLGSAVCATDGTVAEGQACTRTMFGDDNCVKGTECTLRAAATGDFFCRKLCHADTDCSGGQKCTDAGDNNDGLCIPTCTPFGTGCTSPLDCSALFFDVDTTQTSLDGVFACRTAGNGAVGDSCATNGDLDCGPGMICNHFAQSMDQIVCLKLCDGASNACPIDADAGQLDCQMPFSSGTAGFCQ